MAQHITVLIESDLSGKPDAETVSFGLDGKEYAIDLTEQEAAAFRKALDRYVRKARRVSANGKATRSAKVTMIGPEPAVIREWAKREGHTVPTKGRIPAVVREAYAAAH